MCCSKSPLTLTAKTDVSAWDLSCPGRPFNLETVTTDITFLKQVMTDITFLKNWREHFRVHSVCVERGLCRASQANEVLTGASVTTNDSRSSA